MHPCSGISLKGHRTEALPEEFLPFPPRSSSCKTKLEYETGFIIKPRGYNFHVILFPTPTAHCLIIILCHNEIHQAATTKELMEENRSLSDDIDLHANEDYDVINITETEKYPNTTEMGNGRSLGDSKKQIKYFQYSCILQLLQN